MTEQPRVTVVVEDHVADVRLNRPEKMNALDPAMFAGLREAALGVKDNPEVRAVVLSGEGRAFCAGLDLESISGMRDRGDSSGATTNLAQRDGVANWAQQASWLWHELPVPVIAAVHGVALGGGAQVALGADIRIVAPDARISILEIRWGLVPDMTGTAILPRLVGLDVAKELTWSGRMVEGEEAVKLGLATRVDAEPHKAAMEMAAEIAGRNPDAIRAGKRLLNQSGLVPIDKQLIDESKEMGALIGSPNQTEAVMAYFEKRPAVFSDAG